MSVDENIITHKQNMANLREKDVTEEERFNKEMLEKRMTWNEHIDWIVVNGKPRCHIGMWVEDESKN